MGNLIVGKDGGDAAGAGTGTGKGGGDVDDLAGRFPTAPYLTEHSDVVAHLVLDHQVFMHNLITRLNYETRLALHGEKAGPSRASLDGLPEPARKRIEEPAEQLVRYLLFADEAPLEGPASGASGFAEEFSARGPKDPRGRSLREFDLKRRTFRYPCSYLIYSESFDALPLAARSWVYRRLVEILVDGRAPEYERLDDEDRAAVREILAATKPDFAEALRAATAGAPGDPR